MDIVQKYEHRFARIRKIITPSLMDSLLVFAASMCMNISNYAFHLIATRTLDAAAYGNMALMFSFVVIVSYPAQFLQLFVARDVAQATLTATTTSAIATSFLRFVRQSTRYLIIPIGLFCLSAPLLVNLFQIGSVLQVFITATIFLTSLIFFEVTGYFQGWEAFKRLSALLFLIGFVKIATTIAFVPFGLTTELALLSQVIGNGAAVALGFYWIVQWPKRTKRKHKPIHPTAKAAQTTNKTNWQMLVIVTLFALLTNMDLAFAKSFASPDVAGQFAVVTVIGKLILFFPVAIATVVYPKLVKAYVDSSDAHRMGSQALVSVLGLTFIPVVGLFLVGEPLITLVFGAKYAGISGLVNIYAVGMWLYSGVYLLMYYYLAVEDRAFVWLMVAATIIQATILLLVAEDLLAIVQTIALTSLAVIIVSEFVCGGLLRKALPGKF